MNWKKFKENVKLTTGIDIIFNARCYNDPELTVQFFALKDNKLFELNTFVYTRGAGAENVRNAQEQFITACATRSLRNYITEMDRQDKGVTEQI